MQAKKCENSNFRSMPNYVLSKAATPMSSHFETPMFRSKSSADFAIQNPFKVLSTQPDTSQYPFIKHFTFKSTMHCKIYDSF